MGGRRRKRRWAVVVVQLEPAGTRNGTVSRGVSGVVPWTVARRVCEEVLERLETAGRVLVQAKLRPAVEVLAHWQQHGEYSRYSYTARAPGRVRVHRQRRQHRSSGQQWAATEAAGACRATAVVYRYPYPGGLAAWPGAVASDSMQVRAGRYDGWAVLALGDAGAT